MGEDEEPKIGADIPDDGDDTDKDAEPVEVEL